MNLRNRQLRLSWSPSRTPPAEGGRLTADELAHRIEHGAVVISRQSSASTTHGPASIRSD
jgi:hypothetical protein